MDVRQAAGRMTAAFLDRSTRAIPQLTITKHVGRNSETWQTDSVSLPGLRLHLAGRELARWFVGSLWVPKTYMDSFRKNYLEPEECGG